MRAPKKYCRRMVWDRLTQDTKWISVKIEFPLQRPKQAPKTTIFNIEDDLTAVYLSDVCRPELHIRESIFSRKI